MEGSVFMVPNNNHKLETLQDMKLVTK